MDFSSEIKTGLARPGKLWFKPRSQCIHADRHVQAWRSISILSDFGIIGSGKHIMGVWNILMALVCSKWHSIYLTCKNPECYSLCRTYQSSLWHMHCVRGVSIVFATWRRVAFHCHSCHCHCLKQYHRASPWWDTAHCRTCTLLHQLTPNIMTEYCLNIILNFPSFWKDSVKLMYMYARLCMCVCVGGGGGRRNIFRNKNHKTVYLLKLIKKFNI